MEVKRGLKSQNSLDKVLLKFFTDVLYIKEVICIEEYEDIMECTCGDDLEEVFENMLLDIYVDYKRGVMEWETKEGMLLNY